MALRFILFWVKIPDRWKECFVGAEEYLILKSKRNILFLFSDCKDYIIMFCGYDKFIYTVCYHPWFSPLIFFHFYLPPHNSLQIIEKSCEVGIGDVLADAVGDILGHDYMIWLNSLNPSFTCSIELAINAIPPFAIFSSRNFLWTTAWWYLFRVAFDRFLLSACLNCSSSSSIGLSKNDISLGCFTSIAKYLHWWHPMISDIHGLANADLRGRYILSFGS